MIAKLNAVREIPSDKEKIGNVILGFVALTILGVFLQVSRVEFVVWVWSITKSIRVIEFLKSLFNINFSYAVEILILLFIAIYSRTPFLSSLNSLVFLASTFIVGLIQTLLYMGSTQNFGTILAAKVIILFRIVLIVIINYFMWYAKGKGKLSNVLSVLAVATMFTYAADPLYNLTFGMKNNINPIVFYIQIAVYICFSVIALLNLRKSSKERIKIYFLSIAGGVFLVACQFIQKG